MKEIKTEDAVGMVLCHDMTEIIPRKFKGRAFKKGHIICKDDIEHLLRMGKEHIFVYDLAEGYIHEDDAAKRMAAAVCGSGIYVSEVKEGKIELRAEFDGLLKINKQALYKCNEQEEICFATIHGNKLVKKGMLLGAMRVIPLAVKEEVINGFEDICNNFYPVAEVRQLKKAKIGIVTTGNEILKGRIEDKFGEVLRSKFKELECEVIGQILSGDNADVIRSAVMDFISKGADIVAVTGGMSVDPDDRTPAAIKSCGGEIVTYGTPVLPGAMFMLSYVKGIPVVGLPGCVMFAKRTVFDLVLPRILSGEKLSRRDFVELCYGGQCRNCTECRFPECDFGD